MKNMEKGYQWYAVQVRRNKENEAKECLERDIEMRGCQESFRGMYIPMVHTPKKTKKDAVAPLLKGTLFINCILTPTSQRLILSQADIYRFLGGTPCPIPTEELEEMIRQSGCTDFDGGRSAFGEGSAVQNKFNVGDEVTIVGAGFEGLTGVITEFNKSNTRAMVSMKVFNKVMNVGVETSQLRKI